MNHTTPAATAAAPGTSAATPVPTPVPWKGLSLDIARSFYPLPVLLRLVDRLAEFQLNIFHLHLTDDQGWRLEIPGHPELTRTSGKTAVAGGRPGWLTTDDWARLVDRADQRGVTVVPEIDLPGHTNAALHACPALNPGGVAAGAYDGPQVGFSGLSLGLPATEPFLRDVLGAVAAMTPGPWIHIGGDECHATSEEEYVGLIRLATKIVEQTGKRPVAWQEAALAGLGERLALQFWMSVDGEEAWAASAATSDDPVLRSAWRSRQALLREAGRGAPVIMSPARYAYFDMRHTPGDALGQDWAGTIDVAKARSWDPHTVLDGLDPRSGIGVEAALWTEFIHTEEQLDAMLLPRLAAFAEVAARL